MKKQLNQLIRQLPESGFTLCGAEDDPVVKLLLLDFDGTLADTHQANYRAYFDTLHEVNCMISEQEYLDNYFGMRCTEFMATLGFPPAECERLRQRKIELYPRHFDTVRLNRPLWELTQEFRASGGKAWIVSTGSRENICNVMRHLGIEGQVDGMLTGADIEHPKPAPDCFLQAMEAEGISPRQTLIFEDSTIGIEAARRSGASYVIVKL